MNLKLSYCSLFFKPQQSFFNYDRETCRGQAASDRIQVNYPQENSLTFESEEMSCILFEKLPLNVL
jgi:hypothetical protein